MVSYYQGASEKLHTALCFVCLFCFCSNKQNRVEDEKRESERTRTRKLNFTRIVVQVQSKPVKLVLTKLLGNTKN